MPAEFLRTANGELRPVVWAEHGMPVWVRFNRTQVLRCTVQTATGDLLRIVNESHDVDRWLAIGSCYVPKEDPHAR
jgi:hypothetical protein